MCGGQNDLRKVVTGGGKCLEDTGVTFIASGSRGLVKMRVGTRLHICLGEEV
jgi:hypothetical protein